MMKSLLTKVGQRPLASSRAAITTTVESIVDEREFVNRLPLRGMIRYSRPRSTQSSATLNRSHLIVGFGWLYVSISKDSMQQ
jgi:hypothetical protein